MSQSRYQYVPDSSGIKKSGIVVQIIVDHPVLYSLDNGRTMREFKPGEICEVPQYAADGMIARVWARVINAETVPLQPQPQTTLASECSPEPQATPAAEHAPEPPAAVSSIERARAALADRLRRFKQAGKRPTRKQAHQWCCKHEHVLPFIRLKIEVWPKACDLAGVPEWKRSGRIPRKETVTDTEIAEP